MAEQYPLIVRVVMHVPNIQSYNFPSTHRFGYAGGTSVFHLHTSSCIMALYTMLMMIMQLISLCWRMSCRSVSTRQMESIDLCKGPMVAALARLSVEVHASVVTSADQFFQELRRRYVCCCSPPLKALLNACSVQ